MYILGIIIVYYYSTMYIQLLLFILQIIKDKGLQNKFNGEKLGFF